MLTNDINSKLIDVYGYAESECVKEAFYVFAEELKTGKYTVDKDSDYEQVICILEQGLKRGKK